MSPGTTDGSRSVPIAIVHHNLTGEFGFLIPSTLDFVDLEVLIQKRACSSKEDTIKAPLNLKLQPSPGYFHFLMPRGQQARRWATILASVLLQIAERRAALI